MLQAGERLADRPLIARPRLDLLPAPFRFRPVTRFGLPRVVDPTTRSASILRVRNTAQDLDPLLADCFPEPNETSGR